MISCAFVINFLILVAGGGEDNSGRVHLRVALAAGSQ